MITNEFYSALNQLASERDIPMSIIIDGIKSALVTAYKKENDIADEVEITSTLDEETGEVRLLEGKKDITPAGFGRIAAQSAKQVIIQTIADAEKAAILAEMREKVGVIVSGTIFKIDRGVAVVDLGRTHGVLPIEEQIPGEFYQIGKRIKALLKEIVEEEGSKPEIILSRTSPDFVKRLFEQEVPEIASGSVIIKAIAREAGLRTKIAVASTDSRLDPVGSCVGQKGVRVQNVTNELIDSERIDIVVFNDDLAKFIESALSPAMVTNVTLDHANHKAHVEVPEENFSMTLGKGGQNVRLASKLTSWRIDVNKTTLDDIENEAKTLDDLGLSVKTLNALRAGAVNSLSDLQAMSDAELSKIRGIGVKALEELHTILKGK